MYRPSKGVIAGTQQGLGPYSITQGVRGGEVQLCAPSQSSLIKTGRLCIGESVISGPTAGGLSDPHPHLPRRQPLRSTKDHPDCRGEGGTAADRLRDDQLLCEKDVRLPLHDLITSSAGLTG